MLGNVSYYCLLKYKEDEDFLSNFYIFLLWTWFRKFTKIFVKRIVWQVVEKMAAYVYQDSHTW